MRLNKNMRNIIYNFTNGCNSSKKYQLVYWDSNLATTFAGLYYENILQQRISKCDKDCLYRNDNTFR